MLLLLIPTVSQLGEPHKGLRILHLEKKRERQLRLEVKPKIICAFPPSNYGNDIPCLNILSALLTVNSLSKNTAAITVSA